MYVTPSASSPAVGSVGVWYKPALFDQRSMQGKSAPGKLKICRFVHLAHLGARVQERANFQAGAVEFGLPGRFRDACRGVRARKWTPLASMVECGCPVLHLGLRRKRRVAGPLDSPGAAMGWLPLPPVRQHAYSQRRRTQRGRVVLSSRAEKVRNWAGEWAECPGIWPVRETTRR